MRRHIEKRDPEATEEALLRAGAELFAEAGYDGVRVEALAKRAGVNKAMINYHFGGKRKLYLAVIQSAFTELSAQVEALQRSQRPAAELLERVHRRLRHAGRDAPAQLPRAGDPRGAFGGRALQEGPAPDDGDLPGSCGRSSSGAFARVISGPSIPRSPT